MNEPFPDEIADAAWDEAHRRAEVIRRFLRNRPDSRRVSDVLDLAHELGVGCDSKRCRVGSIWIDSAGGFGWRGLN